MRIESEKVAVVTIVRGRHYHLRGQLRGLRASSIAPDLHIVVAMGDNGVHDVVGQDAHVVDIESDSPALPLAAARNLGAQVAIDSGATVLVFLDVDCVPGRELLLRYAAATRRRPRSLLCGPVTYLPATAGDVDVQSLDAMTAPHAARPAPEIGQLTTAPDHDLFWSLSFAVTTQTWTRIGGFCEDYRGYGGEDTDFGWTAAALDIPLVWVGGAHAYHQHHAVSSPPVEHLSDIVVNSRTFMRRWGRWPMTGWLDEFERRGLVRRTDDDISIVRAAHRGELRQ